MKKLIYASLAAATLFASAGAASADNSSFSEQVLAQNAGGASYGYNHTLASFDSIK
jgi:hypothetical protein